MMSGLRKGELPPSRVNDNGVSTNPSNSRNEKGPWDQQGPDSLEEDITRGAASLARTPTSHQTTRPGEGDGFGNLRVPKAVSRDLKEAFDIFDQAKEGTITPAKLGNVMRSLGDNPTEAEVQDLILAVDDDGNGKIEFDEFLNMMSKRVNEPCRGDELAAAFKVFDRSGTGAVTVDDLTDMVNRLGWTDLTLEELKDMIDVADEDGDKRVTLPDFVSLMKSDT